MELYYRNDSQHDPYPNPVPECGGLNPCSLTVFTELMQDVLTEDWDAECGLKAKWSNTGKEIDVIHFTLA